MSVIPDLEIEPVVESGNAWHELGANQYDDVEAFQAYLRTAAWTSATAANRRLFLAPFWAGIRMDPYQLAPLQKALRLPRVNLLIADDVGLGKTVEAGLILREMLLRRRVDFVVITVPPSMMLQWKDELATKFGLSVTIIDREYLAHVRRRRGFGANPWATGSCFLISHRLVNDETQIAGLRSILGTTRAQAMLILDEAHHAAPASGARYAIDSQFTRGIRDLAPRFEHRLLLTATPHNGHTNSFTALLEILDPQRFTRGVPVRKGDLEPVMVRRLKSDLRALGEAFPRRTVDEIILRDLPEEAPDLVLSRMLEAYERLRSARLAKLPPKARAEAKLIFSGLQQRLLCSTAAFAKTLAVHRRWLDRPNEAPVAGLGEAAAAFAFGSHIPDIDEAADDGEEASTTLFDQEDETTATAATVLSTKEASVADLEAELAVLISF